MHLTALAEDNQLPPVSHSGGGSAGSNPAGGTTDRFPTNAFSVEACSARGCGCPSSHRFRHLVVLAGGGLPRRGARMQPLRGIGLRG